MCMFCAAIPAVVAVGANAHRKQQDQIQAEQTDADTPKKVVLPAVPLTVLAVAGLLVGSITYHSSL